MYSQIYVNGVPVDSFPSAIFIKVCPGPGPELACSALLDYGQEIKRPVRKSKTLTDKEGNVKYFYSNAGIMNFMFKNGFDVFRMSDSTNCIWYVKKGIYPLQKPN